MLKILMIDAAKQPEWISYRFDPKNTDLTQFDDENTTVTRNGFDGIALINAWEWDLLLLDHDPDKGIDGLKILEVMAKDPEFIPKHILLTTLNIKVGAQMADILKSWEDIGLIQNFDWVRT